MPKRVLSIGQCGVDHAAICRLIEGQFGAQVVSADLPQDALEQLLAGSFDLVLVNRKLDADYSDGVEVIRQIKADSALSATPIMLVTNYPEHQQSAIAAGAEPGFGKLEYGLPETHAKLSRFLGEPARQ